MGSRTVYRVCAKRVIEVFKIKTVEHDVVFFYVRVTVHRNKFLYNKTNWMHQFPKFTPA